MPSKHAAARHGQSPEAQGVLWDELLCLLAAAAAEPALPSWLTGQELAAPFTPLALLNLSADRLFI